MLDPCGEYIGAQCLHAPEHRLHLVIIIMMMMIIIIIIINCNWVVTRWQWLFYMYTEYEIGY